MSGNNSNAVINTIVVVAVIATVVVAAIATDGATGYAPDPYAWFYTLIIPVFLMLILVAYYNEKDPY
ncbi:MAG: hypothetical protein ACP5GA_06885 [Acidithiobacillus sp.]